MAHESKLESRPVVVTGAQLVEPPEQQTQSIHRRQAFAAEDRWIGHVRTEPGVWSAWHHHGDNDTYLYVLQGRIELQYGADDGAIVRLGPGDFGHVPRNVIHRERTAPGDEGQLVLLRFGHGPAVVNVEGPPGALH